ncbi:Rz1-like lysis system protein LysC [Yersinia alsatica]|uniref:Rz1-like lysis system protein LysC n=1 Tax=Yersinia alsatica TaxID=2890317 RepID=UPI003BB75B8A
MKPRIVSSVLRLRRQLTTVLLAACLSLVLASCANKPRTLLVNPPLLLPPESAMTACEIPEFTGSTWGDSALYALTLKRELLICKGRLDEVIHWRNSLRP